MNRGAARGGRRAEQVVLGFVTDGPTCMSPLAHPRSRYGSSASASTAVMRSSPEGMLSSSAAASTPQSCTSPSCSHKKDSDNHFATISCSSNQCM